MTTTFVQPHGAGISDSAAAMTVEAESARPFLRRDTFYAEVDGGIQFASAGPSFQLSGRGVFQVFERIVPFLGGEVTRSELTTALGSHWPLVETMLNHLNERGFLRWISQSDVEAVGAADRERYAEQIAFLAQYTDTPHCAFAAFRSTPLHLVGAGPIADAVVENLTANGHGGITIVDTSIDADINAVRTADHILILPTVDSYAWFNAHRAHLDSSRCLLVLPSEDRLWVLPHAWQSTAVPGPDWKDALLALEAVGAVPALQKTFIAAEDGLDPLTGRAAAAPVQRMLGAILSYEIFKGLTGAVPPETAVGAISLDVITGETTAHRVLPSAHRGRAAEGAPATPSVVHYAVTEESSRASEYDQWRTLVGAFTMPVVGFDDANLRQLPFKVGVSLGADGSTHLAASLWTLADARIEAITRGYERTVAGLEPAKSRWTLFDVADGSPSEVDAAWIFRHSRANESGIAERSAAAVAVALTAGEASRRAIHKAVAEHLLLEHVKRPAGHLIEHPEGSPAQTFLDEVSAETDGVSYVHLGVVSAPGVETLHVILAILEKNGQTFWHVAAAESQAAAIALTGTEVLSLRQFADPNASTLSMHSWTGLDPRMLIATGSEIPARQVRVLASAIYAPLLSSAGLFAATAIVEAEKSR